MSPDNSPKKCCLQNLATLVIGRQHYMYAHTHISYITLKVDGYILEHTSYVLLYLPILQSKTTPTIIGYHSPMCVHHIVIKCHSVSVNCLLGVCAYC